MTTLKPIDVKKELNFVTTGGAQELHNLWPTPADIVLSLTSGRMKINDLYWVTRIQRHRQGVRIFAMGIDGYVVIDKHEWAILRDFFPVCPRCLHCSTFENPLQPNGYHLYLCEDFFGTIISPA